MPRRGAHMEDWLNILLLRRPIRDLTRRQYAAALDYWRAWHRVRYGSEFPLARVPPRLVDISVIDTFVEDHLYRADEGRLQLAMPTTFREALAAVAPKLPSPLTTEFRITALHTVVDCMVTDVQPEDYPVFAAFVEGWPQIRAKLQVVRASWEAERACTGEADDTAPMAATHAVARMVEASGEDLWGRRDAALVVLLQRLTPQQVVRLPFKDVIPGFTKNTEPPVTVAQVITQDFASVTQSAMGPIRFLDPDCEALFWWASQRENEVSPNDTFLARPPSKNNPRGRLSVPWIRARVRVIARRAGLVNSRGETIVTPRWIRLGYQREFRESKSLFAVIARRSGLTISGVRRLLQGTMPDRFGRRRE